MFVITFYSFKGGVGRTMALVNVGAYLASLGRRVLLVDFDLEAPGLPTYDLARPPNSANQGVVEFVTKYLETGEVPDVDAYIYASDVFPRTGGKLWVMPAGLEDESYQQRLNDINWASLYEKRDGYLMMEDLRQQWDKQLGVEYVLIDSRTGYTDIAGICTRQLPDEVCMVFMPNKQNLPGLVNVAKKVRGQVSIPELRNPKLMFIASNVPDSDDEDGELATLMQVYKERLRYENLTSTIRHYSSMALLNQTVFALKRKNTSLAKDYQSLADQIAESNPEDRVASLAYLKGVIQDYQSGETKYPPSDISRQVDQIVKKHDDGEIFYWAARAREANGDWRAARDLLSDAIASGYANTETYLQRGLANMFLNEDAKALTDAQWVINQAKNVKVEHVIGAVQILLRVDKKKADADAPAIKALSDEDRLFLVESIRDFREGAKLAHGILKRVLETSSLSTEERTKATSLLRSIEKSHARP